MFDFLNPKLMPKVSTKSACMDGYEAENLISNNYLVKSRGFLAYTSIRPPVDVNFQLICSVNMHYVVISTVIGNQKSTGIEIFAKNPKSELISIGHAVFDKPGVVFCSNRMFSKSNPPPNCTNYHVAFFKSNTFRQFTNASEISVRITRTEKSVPCLGKVELWGKVSKSCSQTTMNTVKHIMERSFAMECTSDNEEKMKIDDFVIPDDLKDALTFEIMSLPMTLPSGHTIDQTTLEKCISHDNAYGRQGSDPFTGLQFNGCRKPVFNAALKTRIDMFLLENAHRKEVATVQRTVGSVKTNQQLDFRSSDQINKKRNFDTMYIDSANGVDTAKADVNLKRPKYDVDKPDDSLMETINKVMNSVNFVRFTEDVEENMKSYSCEKCKNQENLYELPCLHLYCRVCLLIICQQLVCEICRSNFCKNEPRKFHVK